MPYITAVSRLSAPFRLPQCEGRLSGTVTNLTTCTYTTVPLARDTLEQLLHTTVHYNILIYMYRSLPIKRAWALEIHEPKSGVAFIRRGALTRENTVCH